METESEKIQKWLGYYGGVNISKGLAVITVSSAYTNSISSGIIIMMYEMGYSFKNSVYLGDKKDSILIFQKPYTDTALYNVLNKNE